MKNRNEAGLLLAWYDEHRRDLPWRRDQDPYRVYVSEVMLQQTRAGAAQGHYLAFLARFPDVRALAGADLESVYKAWEGLGYYARARRLWEAAGVLSREGFPTDSTGWRALPGVGPYTAAAVASICFGERVLAVDGNITRVLMRWMGLYERADLPSAKRAVREEGIAMLTGERPGDGNQALMELGATICLPAAPRCGTCPIRETCRGLMQGNPEEIPRKQPPKGKAVERFRVFVILWEGSVLVRKRADSGLLAGQWEFPHGLTKEQLGALDLTLLRELDAYRHVFTHRIWEMTGGLYLAKGDVPPDGCRWARREGLLALPVPSAMAPFRAAALEAMP